MDKKRITVVIGDVRVGFTQQMLENIKNSHLYSLITAGKTNKTVEIDRHPMTFPIFLRYAQGYPFNFSLVKKIKEESGYDQEDFYKMLCSDVKYYGIKSITSDIREYLYFNYPYILSRDEIKDIFQSVKPKVDNHEMFSRMINIMNQIDEEYELLELSDRICYDKIVNLELGVFSSPIELQEACDKLELMMNKHRFIEKIRVFIPCIVNVISKNIYAHIRLPVPNNMEEKIRILMANNPSMIESLWKNSNPLTNFTIDMLVMLSTTVGASFADSAASNEDFAEPKSSFDELDELDKELDDLIKRCASKPIDVDIESSLSEDTSDLKKVNDLLESFEKPQVESRFEPRIGASLSSRVISGVPGFPQDLVQSAVMKARGRLERHRSFYVAGVEPVMHMKPLPKLPKLPNLPQVSKHEMLMRDLRNSFKNLKKC